MPLSLFIMHHTFLLQLASLRFQNYDLFSCLLFYSLSAYYASCSTPCLHTMPPVLLPVCILCLCSTPCLHTMPPVILPVCILCLLFYSLSAYYAFCSTPFLHTMPPVLLPVCTLCLLPVCDVISLLVWYMMADLLVVFLDCSLACS